MHARLYLYVTFGHQGIQAALHICNIRPLKVKQTLSKRKTMATVFLDRKRVLLVDFMQQRTTITKEVYCETLCHLHRAIQNKRRGMLSSGVVLIHGSAWPHCANVTKDLLKKFNWEVFDHPPYSPDLAPSDFHLFRELKAWLGGQRFATNDELWMPSRRISPRWRLTSLQKA